MPKDYRVEIKVKNNYLLTLLREAGYKNVRQLCLEHGLGEQLVGTIANLKLSVFNSRGKVRPIYDRLSVILRCLPEDLAPSQHHHEALLKNSGNVEISMQEISTLLPGFVEAVPQLPDAQLEQQDFLRVLSDLLDELTPRERLIIERRYGLDGEKPLHLSEVSEELGITKERIRQIEFKALSRLKRKRCKEQLLEVSPIEFRV